MVFNVNLSNFSCNLENKAVDIWKKIIELTHFFNNLCIDDFKWAEVNAFWLIQNNFTDFSVEPAAKIFRLRD